MPKGRKVTRGGTRGFDFSEEADLTNQQLADELAKVTPLTADELNKLLPRKADKERLTELIAIVGSAASENARAAKLAENMGTLGGVVVKLIGAYLRLT
jgi:hypothetical protein